MTLREAYRKIMVLEPPPDVEKRFDQVQAKIKETIEAMEPIKISHVNPNCPGADICEPHGEFGPVSIRSDAGSNRDVDKETSNENANTGETGRKQRAG